MFRVLLLLVGILVHGCATYRPGNIDDLCAIFRGDNDWYLDAKAAHKKWSTPIPLMMSIIYHESSFRPKVRPERPKFLFIPLPRRSSAYGYAQAQDPSWNDYREDTGNWSHDRDDFGDAINFVGWYSDKTSTVLGISKWDGYSQYLAYHEGWGGFSRGSYKKKPELLKVASRVQKKTEQYSIQLKKCQASLDKKTESWFRKIF